MSPAQVARLFVIAERLRSDPACSMEQLADVCNVSKRTIYRYLALLEAAGVSLTSTQSTPKGQVYNSVAVCRNNGKLQIQMQQDGKQLSCVLAPETAQKLAVALTQQLESLQ